MSAANENQGGGRGSSKVLRIGIIHGGKIVEERRLKKRETVSVGSSEKATFSVKANDVPKLMDVFELVGNDYFVKFNEKMDGRLQTGRQPVRDFKKLRADAKVQKKGDLFVAPLTDDSRGKVIFGDVTVLFQFVDPPLPPGKVELPPEVRGSLLSSIDIQFSSIFVAVAVLTVSIVSYASNQPYVEPTSIEQISERYQKLIMPDRLPEPPRDETAQAGEVKTDEKKPEEPPKKKDDEPKGDSKGKSKGDSSKPKGPVSAEDAAKARKEAIAKEVAGKGLLGIIGVKGDKGGALADVFAEGDDVGGDLGSAFSGIQGVDIADSGGAKGTRGGGSGEAATIGNIATEGGGSVSTGKKVEAAVTGKVGTEAPEVEGELSPDLIQRSMRKYLSGVKDCYEGALKRNPKLAGKIVIGFEILETGKVSEFSFPTDNVGSADVRSCIKRRAASWRFPKPDGGSVYVEFPLVFEPSS